MSHVLHKKVEVLSDDESQYICIPNELSFNDNVKEVLIRKVGNELIITPTEKIWESFFRVNADNVLLSDFPDERGEQLSVERESLDD